MKFLLQNDPNGERKRETGREKETEIETGRERKRQRQRQRGREALRQCCCSHPTGKLWKLQGRPEGHGRREGPLPPPPAPHGLYCDYVQ